MRGLRIAMDGARRGFGSRGLMIAKLIALTAVAMAQPSFNRNEVRRIQSFWNAYGRLEVQAPDSFRSTGPWVVRLSAEGSLWLSNYNDLKVALRTAANGKELRSEVPSWDAWLRARIAFDRYQAGLAAGEANSRFEGEAETPTLRSEADPGEEPDDLAHYAGPCPVFAQAVVPDQYSVRFPDGSVVKLADNPAMKADYPSYRFPQGVMSVGTPVKNLPQPELDELFAAAGIDPSTEKVMKAVSMLEGGFDSVNTYDTGFVSVGLIQFACLSKGAGSLGQVLLQEKRNDPQRFQEDFRQFGLDVTDDGSLVAVDIDSGEVVQGAAAAHTIIDDKRLVSVFQHAGARSRAFRVAQLEVAKQEYFPSSDPISVAMGDHVLQCKVCDLIKSEAGLATLMDRKVNTGKLDPLPEVLREVSSEWNCRSLSDLACHEREIVLDCRYRRDYTQDANLTQPGVVALTRELAELPSRHGTRDMRRGLHSKHGGY